MVDCIDVKLDEDCHGSISQRNDDDSCLEETNEETEEQVQESQKKESDLSEYEEAEPEQYTVQSSSRITRKNHPESQIIGDESKGVQTRRKILQESEQSHIALLSTIEPNVLMKPSKTKIG